MSDHLEYLLVIAGVAAACWGQIQRVLAWLRGWVVVSRYCDTPLGLTMVAYLHAAAKRSRTSGTGTFSSHRTHVRALGRVSRVVFEALFGSRRTYWMPSPIWYSPSPSMGENNHGNTPPSRHGDFIYGFSFVRGSVDWEALLLAAADWESEIDESTGVGQRFRVKYHVGSLGRPMNIDGNPQPTVKLSSGFAPTQDSPNRLLRWTHADIQPERPDSTLETMSLREELLAVVRRMKFWLDSRPWYADRGIPWRLGALFHGAPGTGKTSLARGIAEDLDLPVHVIDLASMTNADLRNAWSEMVDGSPCMALIEDIDGVFHGRTNTSNAPGALSFDCLLNCWDGVERVDGVVVIVTTNELDKIDPAILSRPGRIDLIAKFEPLDLAGRVKIADRILRDIDEATAMAAAHVDDPASTFQERCIRLALERRERQFT